MIKLKEGENLVKEIFPKGRMRLKKNEWFKIPFSLIWFTLFIWGIEPLNNKYFMNSFIFKGIIIIMFFGGLYIVFGRFIQKYIKIRYSQYYITNVRLVIYNRFLRTNKSIRYDEFEEITMGKYNKNIGYLIFGEPEKLLVGRVNYTQDEYAFENIENVEDIFSLIQNVKNNKLISKV